MIRAVIVDDEPLARQSLLLLLREHPDVEVVAECTNGVEAIEVLRKEEVDLLFLDIQMPGLSGFEVLERMETPRMPAIVFVTAFDQFAVKAFELNALDYLLKPFGARRFAISIRRARALIEGANTTGFEAKLERLVNTVTPSPSPRFLIHDHRRSYFVSADDVDYIEGCDYYSGLHVGGKQHLVRQTLKEIEAKLAPETFLRVHRSVIVNVEKVAEIQVKGYRSCSLVLKGGQVISVSRSRQSAVKAALKRLSR